MTKGKKDKGSGGGKGKGEKEQAVVVVAVPVVANTMVGGEKDMAEKGRKKCGDKRGKELEASRVMGFPSP